jgi:putative tryptophan/tyrosine transport system substrate-binding protein
VVGYRCYLDLTDPVGNGSVSSLNRPGGNVTGVSTQDADTAGKRLAVLRQAVPTLRRLAIVFDAGYASTVRESDQVRAAARALDLEVVPLEVRHVQDVAPVFAALSGKADALYIVIDSLVNASRTGILTFAAAAHLPSIASAQEYAQAGALLSYGPDQADLYRRAANIVDKILRGAKAGDIPVEQP